MTLKTNIPWTNGRKTCVSCDVLFTAATAVAAAETAAAAAETAAAAVT